VVCSGLIFLGKSFILKGSITSTVRSKTTQGCKTVWAESGRKPRQRVQKRLSVGGGKPSEGKKSER
jgi:hypothetical protein